MNRYFIPMVFCLLSLNTYSVRAQSEKGAKAKTTEDTEISEEKKSGDVMSSEYILTDSYVHDWEKFPSIPETTTVLSGEQFSYVPYKGRAVAVIFLASWCKPCQFMIEDLLAIEKKYSNLHTDFIYVFSHDREKDARNFVSHIRKEFREDGFTPMGTAIFGHTELLRKFHTPSLPGIYLGDRWSWLAARYLRTKPEDLKKMDLFLGGINAI